jgi:phosphotransacetylase/acyl dehydratase
MQFLESRLYDDLKPGDRVEIERVLGPQDYVLFSAITGDMAPSTEQTAEAGQAIAPGAWGGVLAAGVVGSELPGPGTVVLEQRLDYHLGARVGDRLTIAVTVREKLAERQVLLDCEGRDQDGALIFSGEMRVLAPVEVIRRPRVLAPDVRLQPRGQGHDRAMAAARGLAPIRTAVVHPVDAASLTGALDAGRQGLILPVLVGPRHRIEAAAEAASQDLTGVEIVDTLHSHAAAARAVELVRAGRAEALMKGALHTDELMAEVMNSDTGLRTERRISHVFALDVPTYHKPLLITDAAINIYPTLEDKRDIVQNAIDLAQALGVERPKVAILSAVETVYPRIASTVEAAALCKMADRGQITGGVLDGPLAFDNAISRAAAEAKGIRSEVAGDADILVAPDLEAGNMIAKQLIYLAGAEAAGLALGARAPIMLTSRSDGARARVVSCVLAQLYVHHRLKGATA